MERHSFNIPPNKEGKFADADVARLKEFKATLDQMYATDFAKGATVTASSTRQNHLYKESHLTDGKMILAGRSQMMPQLVVSQSI